jgi:diadenosine tetraphosphate (Ap4A) HIT family hydrolase
VGDDEGGVNDPREKVLHLSIHVIPLKSGCWRVVQVGEKPSPIKGMVWLSPQMLARWTKAYQEWWERKGQRLAISPEMWA